MSFPPDQKELPCVDTDIWTEQDDLAEREFQRLAREFQHQGYRDGKVEGEEHVLQRSFDLGFKDAADVGRKLGNIQGLLAALQTVASDDALKRELSCELQKWIELTHQKVALQQCYPHGWKEEDSIKIKETPIMAMILEQRKHILYVLERLKQERGIMVNKSEDDWMKMIMNYLSLENNEVS
jgi:hypothetical protein